MPDATPDMLEARRRKLFVLAKEATLTRDERIELSKAILWRDITSWRDLDDDQVRRMLDALEGFEKVRWILANR